MFFSWIDFSATVSMVLLQIFLIEVCDRQHTTRTVPQSVDSKNNEKIQHNYGRPDSWTAKLQHYTRVSMELIRV